MGVIAPYSGSERKSNSKDQAHFFRQQEAVQEVVIVLKNDKN